VIYKSGVEYSSGTSDGYKLHDFRWYKNKQTLKVMRSYQVYATQNVIERLKKVDFECAQIKLVTYGILLGNVS